MARASSASLYAARAQQVDPPETWDESLLKLADKEAAARLPPTLTRAMGEAAIHARMLAGPAGRHLRPDNFIDLCDHLYRTTTGIVVLAKDNQPPIDKDTLSIIVDVLKLANQKLHELRGDRLLTPEQLRGEFPLSPADVLQSQVLRRRLSAQGRAAAPDDEGKAGEAEEGPPVRRSAVLPPAYGADAITRKVQARDVSMHTANRTLVELELRANTDSSEFGAALKNLVVDLRSVLGISPRGQADLGQLPKWIDKLRALRVTCKKTVYLMNLYNALFKKLLMAIGDRTNHKDHASRIRLCSFADQLERVHPDSADHAVITELAANLRNLDDGPHWRRSDHAAIAAEKALELKGRWQASGTAPEHVETLNLLMAALSHN